MIHRVDSESQPEVVVTVCEIEVTGGACYSRGVRGTDMLRMCHD